MQKANEENGEKIYSVVFKIIRIENYIDRCLPI